MEAKLELYRTHQQLQEKFVYYLVALSVSAIGFSVYCTIGKPLQYSHAILLIAVLAWAGSIFCGLHFVKNLIYAAYNNCQRLNVQESGQNIYYQSNLDILNTNLQNISTDLKNYGVWQEYLFYTGVVLFIVWHILQMYLIK